MPDFVPSVAMFENQQEKANLRSAELRYWDGTSDYFRANRDEMRLALAALNDLN